MAAKKKTTSTPKKARKKLFFHWENRTVLTEAQAELIKAKSKRRAKRYFAGATVNHRVIAANQDSITFAFQRRTHKVTIRWRLATI